MQQQFNPDEFYQQVTQSERPITPLLLLFVIISASFGIIYLVLWLLDIDFEILQYIYAIMNILDIGLWIIPLVIGVRTKMKKLKPWFVGLTIFILLMQVFWAGRSVYRILDYSNPF